MAPSVQFSSVTQSCPTLCDPMTEVSQASLSITNSRSLPKLMSIESMDDGDDCLVQSLHRVRLFGTPWTAACQASLSFTVSQSLLEPMSIESVTLSNHLIFSFLFLLLPSIFPSIRVFSYESVLCIRWPKDWSFHFSISLSNEYSGLISFRI